MTQHTRVDPVCTLGAGSPCTRKVQDEAPHKESVGSPLVYHIVFIHSPRFSTKVVRWSADRHHHRLTIEPFDAYLCPTPPAPTGDGRSGLSEHRPKTIITGLWKSPRFQ